MGDVDMFVCVCGVDGWVWGWDCWFVFGGGMFYILGEGREVVRFFLGMFGCFGFLRDER